MEILGDDEPGPAAPAPRRWPIGTDDRADEPATSAVDVTPDPGSPRDRQVDERLDEPVDGAARTGRDDGAASDPREPGAAARGRLVVDAVLGPESLGLAGLLVAVVAAVTSGVSPAIVMVRPQLLSGTSPAGTSLADVYGSLVALFGVVALGLGVAATLRLRASSPAWTRGVAGAAVILAVLLLLLAGYGIWTAEPVTPEGGPVS